jgi:hypothetical protein
LFQICLKLAQWFWRRFVNDPTPFLHFVIISPLKEIWPFIWTNSNSLHPRITCIKFDWIWPAGSGQKRKKKCIFTLSLLSPLRKGLPPLIE